MPYALSGTAFSHSRHLLYGMFTPLFWFSKVVSKNICKLDDTHNQVETDSLTRSKEDCIFQMSKNNTSVSKGAKSGRVSANTVLTQYDLLPTQNNFGNSDCVQK